MQFNVHSNLKTPHAIFGASNYHWLNYDEEKIIKRYLSSYSTTVGTALHELAKKLIENRIRLTKHDKKLVLFWLLDQGIPKNVINIDKVFENLMNYVNDAIGYQMTPEVVLYFTDNCFGTADSISFDNNLLRIHDYKSGDILAHMEQLEVYAALFCLEYHYKPNDISTELRIYQSKEIVIHNPDPKEIMEIIETTKRADRIIQRFKEGK